MKVSQLWQADKKSKLKRRVALIVPTLMLAVSLAFVTLYSQRAGNFTLEVERNSRKHIQIGETLSDGKIENPTAVLRTGNQKTNEITYYQDVLTKIENIHQGHGVYREDNLNVLNYTFYLTNPNTQSSIDIEYSIVLEENINQMDSAIRIVIVKNGEHKMYQKKETENPIDYPYYPDSDFKENTNEIIKETVIGLKSGEVMKFSVIVWLDVSDPDTHKPEMETGGIKFSMMFKTKDGNPS